MQEIFFLLGWPPFILGLIDGLESVAARIMLDQLPPSIYGGQYYCIQRKNMFHDIFIFHITVDQIMGVSAPTDGAIGELRPIFSWILHLFTDTAFSPL